MPELPEVEALKDFLTEHLTGHEIVRALPVAISVLKTYDPPLTAVEGREVTAVRRYGKFLALATDGGPHLVTHLARAGWLHWKDPLPSGVPRPGKGPLALRVALETGAGFDLTEAGTQKRLAVYVVTDPAEVPGSRGSDRTRWPTTSTRRAWGSCSPGNAAGSRAPCATRA